MTNQIFSFFIFLSTQTSAAASARIGVKAGVLDAVLAASFPVQALLLILVGCSIISWAIIYAKYRQFQNMNSSNQEFNDFFWKAKALENVHNKIDAYAASSLSKVFTAGYIELQRIADSSLAKNSDSENLKLSGIDNLERAIQKSIGTEVSNAEARLNFLATTGSTAPFVGLLGTVIGIMSSFTSIASSGSASLAVVAPGIAEALFSTAVGLFAAIPAVVAYNYFIGRIRKIEIDLNNFGSDFLNVAKRNFFGDK